MMKDIKYIAYYSDSNEAMHRHAAPSADTKVSYIITALKESGHDVEVISKCVVDKCDSLIRKYDAYTTTQCNGTSVHFIPDLTSRNRIIRHFARMAIKHSVKKYIKNECVTDDCSIIIYHSLGMYDVIKLLKKYNKKFVLEVEEIYSDVLTKKKKKNRRKEDYMFRAASSYIFSTEMLNKEVNIANKPYVVCNGTYSNQAAISDSLFANDGKIHCLYAGTLDPRKGGAAAAAAAAFLPENYHIHILGFGTESEIDFMQRHIEDIAKVSNATVTYDGCLTGNKYISFVQSCDIGLSTQNPDAAFNATSFPSKILSYMSNGLRVVSVRIPAIETSAVGKHLYYYDMQTPEEIANAILAVDINDNYDSRQIISGLNSMFKEDISMLLQN